MVGVLVYVHIFPYLPVFLSVSGQQMKSAVNIRTEEYFVVMVSFGNSWKRSKLAGQEDHDGEIMAGECPCRLKFFPIYRCFCVLVPF